MVEDLLLHGLPMPTNSAPKVRITDASTNVVLTSATINCYYTANGSDNYTLPDVTTLKKGDWVHITGGYGHGSANTVKPYAGQSIFYNGRSIKDTTHIIDVNEWYLYVFNGVEWEVFASSNKQQTTVDVLGLLPSQVVKTGRVYGGYLNADNSYDIANPGMALGFRDGNAYGASRYRKIGTFQRNSSDQVGAGFVSLKLYIDDNWYSDNNRIIEAIFFNRGVFDYWWTQKSNTARLSNYTIGCGLLVYGINGGSGTMTDGTYEVWLYLEHAYAHVSWNIENCNQFVISEAASGTPTGTLYFDSRAPLKYPPHESANNIDRLNNNGSNTSINQYLGNLVMLRAPVSMDGAGTKPASSLMTLSFGEGNMTTGMFDHLSQLYHSRNSASGVSTFVVNACPNASGYSTPDSFKAFVNNVQKLKLSADDSHLLNGHISIVPANASNTVGVGIITAASNATDQFFMSCISASGTDNEFVLRNDGNGYCDGAWTGGGADYAEYFEWKDGNPNNEDRRGWSVVIDGEFIRQAQAGEVPFGVISANPCVVGDAGWNLWKGKYLLDDFGSYISEMAEFWEWYVDTTITETVTKRVPTGETTIVPVTQDDGTIVQMTVPVYESKSVEEVVAVQREKVGYFSDRIPAGITVPDTKTVTTQSRRKLNPAYDPTEEYVPRSKRKEWSLVGFLGKLRVLNTQVINPKWVKLTTISDKVDLYLVAAS